MALLFYFKFSVTKIQTTNGGAQNFIANSFFKSSKLLIQVRDFIQKFVKLICSMPRSLYRSVFTIFSASRKENRSQKFWWNSRSNRRGKSCEISSSTFYRFRMPKNIYYSDKYTDEHYEYRHVMLPKELAKMVPKTHLMSETEWRNLGVQQSQGKYFKSLARFNTISLNYLLNLSR